MNTTTIMGLSTDSLLNSLVHCFEGPSGLLYSFPKADWRSLAGELLREWKLCQASDRRLTLFLRTASRVWGSRWIRTTLVSAIGGDLELTRTDDLVSVDRSAVSVSGSQRVPAYPQKESADP